MNKSSGNPNNLNYKTESGEWYYDLLDKKESKLDDDFNKLKTLNLSELKKFIEDNDLLGVIPNEIKETINSNYVFKTCNKCGKEVELSNFYKSKRSLSGFSYICSKCNSIKVWNCVKKKMLNDPVFRLSQRLRGSINQSFKKKGYKKTSRTYKLLGTDFKTVFNHIEKQFLKDMNWDNNTINGWHIDHIIPLASATTKEELIKLFHYTNLQPMWADENRSKKDKVPLVSKI